MPLEAPCVAVVTGGATGIGAALAWRLAERGTLCVLLGRREDRLRETAGEIGAEYEVCDIADRADVERTAERIRERHPAVGLLVNNAGIPGHRARFLDLPPERIEELIRINYLGGVWCVRAFLPTLEAAAPSWVVNVVSVAGTVALGSYSASKHAQLAFSRSIGAELHVRGIRVLTVNPGFAQTEGFPQEHLRRGRLRRLVVGPDYVAERIIRALDRRRTEIFVPSWYRAAAWLQAAAPATLSRAIARRSARRGR